MPICQQCNYQWSFRETWKRSFTLTNQMPCPNCQKTQFLTLQSRKRSSILTFLTISLIMLFNIFFGPTEISLVLLGAFTVIWTVTYPYMVKLSNTEEHILLK